jgi:hypothetical protein
MNYDDYKTDSPDQRCADAECAECSGEFFSEDLTDGICKICTAKFELMEEQCEICGELNTTLEFKDGRCTDHQPAEAEWGECPDSFTARMARKKKEDEEDEGAREDARIAAAESKQWDRDNDPDWE